MSDLETLLVMPDLETQTPEPLLPQLCPCTEQHFYFAVFYSMLVTTIFLVVTVFDLKK